MPATAVLTSEHRNHVPAPRATLLLPAHGVPRRQAENPEGGDGDDGDGEARVDDRGDRGRA
eukprot:1999134-Prymnesium_polylepis.1